MNASLKTLIGYVENILSEQQLSPGAVRWIKTAISEHVSTGEPINRCLGLDAFPNGLSKAWRDRQFRLHIARALAFIPATGTTHSRAKILRGELLRTLRRPGRKPMSELEAHLQAAIRVNPDPKISIPNLWKIIDGIQKGDILFDETFADNDYQHISEGQHLGIQSREIRKTGGAKP